VLRDLKRVRKVTDEPHLVAVAWRLEGDLRRIQGDRGASATAYAKAKKAAARSPLEAAHERLLGIGSPAGLSSRAAARLLINEVLVEARGAGNTMLEADALRMLGELEVTDDPGAAETRRAKG